jgi:glycosyltransferase involved in cell wall biosynthesis
LAHDAQLFLPRVKRQRVREILRETDVVHLHGHRHALQWIVEREALRLGVPCVWQPNGTARVFGRLRRTKRLLDRSLLRRSFDRPTRVIAVSQWEKGELEKQGVPASNIDVVPNPVEQPPQPSGGDIRRARLRVGYLGQCVAQKRLDLLVDAVAQCVVPVSLSIAGVSSARRRWLERKAAQAGLRDLELHGVVQGDERWRFLEGLDLLSYVTEGEAFGLVPLEALSVGTPVLVADDGGAAEWAGTFDGALTTRRSAHAMARALEGLPETLEELRRGATGAREEIRGTLGAPAVAGRLEVVYESAQGAS